MEASSIITPSIYLINDILRNSRLTKSIGTVDEVGVNTLLLPYAVRISTRLTGSEF